ncbi:MAG: hypothetical protein BGN88_00565 [Clostridiales bacterium 43-6]|nr:MAG: hypothetical protein BGN88_00565 [Clostridiales bacterium 43-6]
MSRTKRNNIIFFIIGAIGFLAGMLGSFLSDKYNSNVMGFYFIVIVIFGVCYFIYYSLALQANQKYDDLYAILVNDQNTDFFIEKSEELLSKVKIKKLYQMHEIQLARGYDHAGNVSKAIGRLTRMNVKQLSCRYRGIYYSDLVLYYLKNQNQDTAKKIYEENKAIIQRRMSDPDTAANVIHTVAVMEYINGNTEESIRLLRQAMTQFENQGVIASVKLWLAGIYVETDKYEEAQILIDDVLNGGNLPAITKSAERLQKLIIEKENGTGVEV